MESNLEFKVCKELGSEREKYFELLETGFPNRNVPEKVQKRSENENLDFVFLYDKGKMVGAVSIIHFSENIFGIYYTTIHPDYRGRELGSKLMEKVHEEFKGLFLLTTRDASSFYEKLGYTTFKKSETHSYMVYSNSDKLGF